MSAASPSKPLDRRQKKTRQAIQTALLSLMKDKPLERITITELAAAAGVNRKTFYNHYSSIQEVRAELEEQYIDLIFSLMGQTADDNSTFELSPFIEHLVEAMASNPVRTRLIFESGEHLYLTERLKKALLPYLSQLAEQRQRQPDYLPYVLEYAVCGTTALLNAWVHAEHPVPPQELATLVAALLRSTASIRDFT